MNLPSGRIQASKYSQDQKAASWYLCCHLSQEVEAKPPGLFLVKLQGETEPFFFQRFFSGCVQQVSSKEISMFSETDRIGWILDKAQKTWPGEFFLWRSGWRPFLVQHFRWRIYLDIKKILILTICLYIVERDRPCRWLTQFVVVSDYPKFHKGFSYCSSFPI